MPPESQEPQADSADARPPAGSRVGNYLDLTKPRLAFLSTLTGLAGYLAAPQALVWIDFFAVSLGIFLAAAGALALNQWIEHEIDAKMDRTRDRPLPSRRISRPAAFSFGLAAASTGVVLSAFLLPWVATLLIVATIASYLLLYTPLKRRTHWCTHVGALPGALPPLIGWSAATGSIGGLGVWLFLIVLIWQMPHFFAIAWLCREDYAKGGLRILSVTHGDGRRLLFENYLFLLLLFPICLGPVLTGEVGWIYGASSLLLNGIFLFEGIRFAATVRSGGSTGNRLFLFSLLYLPVLFIILLFDQTPA